MQCLSSPPTSPTSNTISHSVTRFVLTPIAVLLTACAATNPLHSPTPTVTPAQSLAIAASYQKPPLATPARKRLPRHFPRRHPRRHPRQFPPTRQPHPARLVETSPTGHRHPLPVGRIRYPTAVRYKNRRRPLRRRPLHTGETPRPRRRRLPLRHRHRLLRLRLPLLETTHLLLDTPTPPNFASHSTRSMNSNRATSSTNPTPTPFFSSASSASIASISKSTKPAAPPPGASPGTSFPAPRLNSPATAHSATATWRNRFASRPHRAEAHF